MRVRLSTTLCSVALAAAITAPVSYADTVLELFTSQSCSSCPPADALLGEWASKPGVLALSMHVDYWDRLGWKDPYSSPGYTARQRRYAGLLRDDGVYTPEMVVNGRTGVVGSDRRAVAAAVASDAGPQIPLRVFHDGDGVAVEVGAGAGIATLLVVGFDPMHVTRIGGGENGGRTLNEFNVVRSLMPAGSWTGPAMRVVLAKPAGERIAALLQRQDGSIIGAASLP